MSPEEFVAKLEKATCPADEQPCGIPACGCLLELVVSAVDPEFSGEGHASRLVDLLEASRSK